MATGPFLRPPHGPNTRAGACKKEEEGQLSTCGMQTRLSDGARTEQKVEGIPSASNRNMALRIVQTSG